MNASAKMQLSCPQCSSRIRVLVSFIGKQIRCPQCDAVFKVPGTEKIATQSDDWLNLDSPQSAPDNELSDTRSDDSEVARRSLAPTAEGPVDGEAFSLIDDDLPSLPDAVTGIPASDNLALENEAELANLEEGLTEFRVTCTVCGSLAYAKPHQVGQQIQCGDCFSPITVQKPAVKKSPYRPDIDNAQAFSFAESDQAPSKYVDPLARSAEELIREAEADHEEDEEPTHFDNPDVKGWLSDIFSIFLDPGVPLHLLVLSVIASVIQMVGLALGHLGAQFIAGILVFLYSGFVVTCGFAILETVANGHQRVSEWPYFNPMEWVGRMLMTVVAITLSAGPGALLGSLMLGPGLGMIAVTMLSLYLIFPYVLLSMLESESVFLPFSAEITKSTTRCSEAWGVLYMSSGLLFFLLFLFYLFCKMLPPMVSVFLETFATYASLFAYFSMIGGLAHTIGKSVNAPPMKNDIDRVRARERAERV